MKTIYTDYMDTLAIYGCAIVNYAGFPRRFTLIADEYYPGDLSSEEAEHEKRKFYKIHEKLLKEERKIIEEADKREREQGIGKYAKAKPDFKEIEKLKSNMLDHTLAILNFIQKNRHLSKSKLWTQISQEGIATRNQFDKSIDYLKDTDLVKQVEIGVQLFYPLTEKGYEFLKTPLKNRRSATHFEHDWHCEKIAEQLRRRGYNPVREYGSSKDSFFETKINGKTVKVYNRIDVYAELDGKHVAYEFINTSFYTLDVTVHKCLHVMGMDELIFVCKKLPNLTKAREKLESTDFWKHSKDALQGKIKYRTYNNLF